MSVTSHLYSSVCQEHTFDTWNGNLMTDKLCDSFANDIAADEEEAEDVARVGPLLPEFVSCVIHDARGTSTYPISNLGR